MSSQRPSPNPSQRDTSQRASAFQRAVRWLVGKQVGHPYVFLVLAALLAVPCYFLARQLELRTGFDSLLPDNKPSVIELKRVASRTAGVGTLAIIIDGQDRVALQRFSDALLPPLRAIGPDWVGTAENGVHAEKEFLSKRQALYVPLNKLKDLHDRVEERVSYEIHGNLVDDDAPEPITRETIEKELQAEKKDKVAGPPYPDGYYQNAEGTRLIVLIRTPVVQMDLDRSFELQRRVREVVEKVNPKSFHPSIQYGFAGDVVTSAEQYNVVKNDLATVGAAGIAMILFIDLLFFLRLRAVVAMALSIGTGLLWTFALTRFAIGHLNTASGFLVSIIFGNGINFGILLRARYGEARRAGMDLQGALEISFRDTFQPTLTAAAAAGAGYLSLATTNFRGFKDFGAIGGYGMLLCWAANFLLMPPLLAVFERAWPTWTEHNQITLWQKVQAFIDHGIPFGAPFAWVSRKVRAPFVAFGGVAIALLGLGLSARYLLNDPLEYDLSRLENDKTSVDSAATRLGRGMTDITGRTGQDGMAIMTERLDQVKPLLAELEKRRVAGGNDPPFQKTVSIFNLIPNDQEEKVQLLNQMRKRIDRLRELHKINDADWDAMQPYLPPKDLKPFGVEDLPERVARPFTERDGTRGRIVYVVPTDGKSVRDLHYALKWADSYRVTKLPSGEVIFGSGRAVIFADMLQGVMDEAPQAMLLSALMAVGVVVFAFYRGKSGLRAVALVLGSLLTGVAGMGGVLYLTGERINFLNFIAFPITLGIGVDYAINLVHRWRIEPHGKIPEIVRETGGAVVLCSLTTVLGYMALMRSVNPAVRSFGFAAVIGELTCLTAVMVVLPAILKLIESRDAARPVPAVATQQDASQAETRPDA